MASKNPKTHFWPLSLCTPLIHTYLNHPYQLQPKRTTQFFTISLFHFFLSHRCHSWTPIFSLKDSIFDPNFFFNPNFTFAPCLHNLFTLLGRLNHPLWGFTFLKMSKNRQKWPYFCKNGHVGLKNGQKCVFFFFKIFFESWAKNCSQHVSTNSLPFFQ